MQNRYFTLAVFENGAFSAHFGDFDYSVVEAKVEDYVDRGYRRNSLVIIVSACNNTAISAVTDALTRRRTAKSARRAGWRAL